MRALLFSGRAYPALPKEVAAQARIPLGNARIGHFADGELDVQIKDDVEGAQVFVLQPTCSCEAIVELLLLIDALKRGQPRHLTVLLSYYGYGRQDKSTSGQSPISAYVMARLLNHSGADALVTVELHAPAISGFFTLPHQQLHTANLFAGYIKDQALDGEIVVVSPDQGGIGRAAQLNEALGTGQEIIVLKKRRSLSDQCRIRGPEHPVDLTGLRAILIDDIVSTGRTLVQAAQWLADRGADSIWACVTHLVASPDLPRRLADSAIEVLIVTDSLPCPESLGESNIQIVSLVPLLASAIFGTEQAGFIGKMTRHWTNRLKSVSIKKRASRRHDLGLVSGRPLPR